jgi:hypothetical protein
MHQLKLLVEDSQLDANILVLKCISVWDDLLSISNRTIMVQAPGFQRAVEVLLPKNGIMSYDSRNIFGISEVSPLPDGLYTITYSVSPNDQVYIVKYHYRTAYLEQRLYRKMGALLTDQDKHDIDRCGNVVLTKLQNVYASALILLEALKGSISGNADLVAADKQYNEIVRLLDGIKNID